MMKKPLRRRYVFTLHLVLSGFVTSSSLSAQHLADPIGEEAFRVLTAFYDYDAGIPLEARVVELKDRSESVRRKVVFRSARSFLVPGYLEFPKHVEPPYPCVLLMHGWSGSKDDPIDAA